MFIIRNVEITIKYLRMLYCVC